MICLVRFLVWRIVCPYRVNDSRHLVHGGNQGDSVWFALVFIFLEVGFELIVVEDGHTACVVESGAEDGIVSFGDVSLAI